MSDVFGVIGAGTMGNGIAQVAARAGFDVVMRDVGQEFLARGMTSIDKSLQRDVDKERLSKDEKRAIMARIKTTTDIGALSEAVIVVEAVNEDLKVKTEVFRSLDEVTKTDAILASNTSSISITKLGAITKRPDKVIGMHFMNPVPVMKLVEIIRGAATSDIARSKFGRQCVRIRNDHECVPAGDTFLDVSRVVRHWSYANVFHQDLRTAPANDAEEDVVRLRPLEGDLESKAVSVKRKR